MDERKERRKEGGKEGRKGEQMKWNLEKERKKVSMDGKVKTVGRLKEIRIDG